MLTGVNEQRHLLFLKPSTAKTENTSPTAISISNVE